MGYFVRVFSGFWPWLHRNRWLLAALLAAFAVRLHWNLLVHPLGDYISSDMRGYATRADQLINRFGDSMEYHAFFPYGTHYLIALVKLIFGQANYQAVGVVYALLGTAIVYHGYRIAERVSSRPWVPPLLGMILVFYYPLISLGGYTLSEVPYAVFLLAAGHALLRLVQEGKSRDAWMAGVHAGIATAIRPQILMSIAVFGLVWLLFRKHTQARLKHLVFAAIPISAVLAFSAARVYHHTGPLGLVSENGRFNELFGRCHNKKAIAIPPKGRGGGRILFGPPPLLQLAKRATSAPKSWVQLDPAIGAELTYSGYIADAEPLSALKRKCIAKTGFLGQMKYAAVNVLMLSGYNVPWPDSGSGRWRIPAGKWQTAYTLLIAGPALLMAFTCFMRRTVTRQGMLSLHIWALLVTAAIYFGDTRLRAPYDPMLILLAIEAYVYAGAMIGGRLRRLFRRGAAK